MVTIKVTTAAEGMATPRPRASCLVQLSHSQTGCGGQEELEGRTGLLVLSGGTGCDGEGGRGDPDAGGCEDGGGRVDWDARDCELGKVVGVDECGRDDVGVNVGWTDCVRVTVNEDCTDEDDNMVFVG